MNYFLLALLALILVACPDNGLDPNAQVNLEPPSSTNIESADTLTLHAAITGSSRQGLTWSANAGSIDASGLFTPPDTTTRAIITVTSQANPQSQASVSIHVTRSAHIDGTLYWDANASGTRNTDEPALMGWQVYLDNNNNGILDSAEPRAYTDAAGQYSLTRLHAGSYKVRYRGHLGYGSSLISADAPVVRPQIVGGSQAGAGQYPFITALLYSNTTDPYVAQFCGASLIAPQWVLTAAHCVFDDNNKVLTAGAVQVAVGISRLANPMTRLSLTQVIPHPGYNPAGDSDNDMALLRLAAPVKNLAVAPLEPDQVALAATAVKANIVGWGALRNGGSFPADYPIDLYHAQVPIVDQATCSSAYGGHITDNMICAGLPQGGVDTCQGDSGGPLLVPAGAGWVLAGATSFGNGCALPGVPGVYARVSQFNAWLESQLGRGGDGLSSAITLGLGEQGGASFAVQP